MSKYADFVFNEDGTFEIAVHGFTSKQGQDFTEPLEKELAPLRRVEHGAAGLLKIPTSRVRMARSISPRNASLRCAVLVAVPDPDGHRRQRAFEILLEAGRARVPKMDSRE